MERVRDNLLGLASWYAQRPRDRARWLMLSEQGRLYALVDVARDPELLEVIAASGEAYCALDETREPDDLGDTAPVLVAVSAGSSTLTTLLEEAWATGSVIFCVSDEDFFAVYRHLLRRAGVDPTATDPRFWDPTVLRALLTAEGDAHREFFGPIRVFVTEALTPDALERYAWNGHSVERSVIPLS